MTERLAGYAAGQGKDRGKPICPKCSSRLLAALLVFAFAGTLVGGIASAAPAGARTMQPFPHIASFTWGGAAAWYEAKFDMVVTSKTSTAYAQTLKALNPNILIFSTRDINGGAGMETSGKMPEAAWAHTSSGVRCLLYSEDTFLANYTDYAPALPEFAGKRYNEFVGDWFASIVDLSFYDGYASDGLWVGAPPYGDDNPCTHDIDLNGNHVNDYREGIDVDAAFRVGAEKVTASLRRTAGEAYVILNSGGWDSVAWGDKNGMIGEDASLGQTLDWWWWIKDTQDEFAARGRKPMATLLLANMDFPGTGGTPDPTRDDFQFMRFVFTLVTLSDGYLSITADPWGSYYWADYYDEFDVDLGIPTSGPQELEPHVFVRFFEKGAVLHNSSGHSATVTADRLVGLQGYNGPYQRFQGGQDPTVNDGRPFDQAHPVSLSLRPGHPYLGDGIVLVNSPRTVVTDLLIDNTPSGVSPGSPNPVLSGFTPIQDCGDTIQDEFTLRCAIHYDSHPAALADGGSNARAVFTPRIGVPGLYEVFEWHGRLVQATAANRVAHQINHSGGVSTVTVDQSQNSGRWNSLGTFWFDAGLGGKVTILAEGAQGIVVADGIRLAWRGESEAQTFADVPPSHWAYDDIEQLYQDRTIAGCATNPLRYCPEATMTRGEMAVFIERGVHGGGYLPPAPAEAVFADVPLAEGFANWADAPR